MTFCILVENCAVYDRHSKLSGFARQFLCEGCINRARSDLNLLRYDFVDLSQHLPPADSRSGDAHIFRPKPESSPPIDMRVLALRDDLVELLTGAEDALRSWVGDRPRQDRVRDGYAVDQAVRYLSERVDDLASVPIVRDPPGEPLSGSGVLPEFGAVHRRARRCVGLLEPVVGLPGLCPKCSVPALCRRDDKIWCQRCRAAFTRTEYYASLRMQFAPVTPDQPSRFT